MMHLISIFLDQTCTILDVFVLFVEISFTCLWFGFSVTHTPIIIHIRVFYLILPLTRESNTRPFLITGFRVSKISVFYVLVLAELMVLVRVRTHALYNDTNRMVFYLYRDIQDRNIAFESSTINYLLFKIF